MLGPLYQKNIETDQPYESWLELVKLLASGTSPSGLTIKGSISLAMLRIRSLPESLIVLGDLDLQQCQRLSFIGNGLKVVGNLLIGGGLSETPAYQKQLKEDPKAPAFLRTLSKDNRVPIKYLPEFLEVEGDLIIRGVTALKALPKQYVIGRSLFISNADELEKLPDSLFLIGDLILVGCSKLRKLPANLTAKRLILIGCGVEEIPESIDIEEEIYIEGCSKLTSLPSSIKCLETGNLKYFTVDNCPVNNLPDSINAKKVIKLFNLTLKEIKANLKAETISIKKCKQLSWIKGKLSPKWSINLNDCKNLEKFSSPLTSFQVLKLKNCESLREFPALPENGSKLQEIDLRNCIKLMQLPENMQFNGRLELSGCGLKSLPSAMKECRIFWQKYWVTPDIIFYPEKLTPSRILTEPSAEIRRLMLEKVGIEKVLKNAGATTIDKDKDPGGERKLVEVQVISMFNARQKARYLKCFCPSTGREYLLPVPLDIASCHSAAAWLAGFENPNDYHPIQET